MAYGKALRKSVPLLISIAGTSGSGKTYSALLMAKGLAGDKGRIGFLDTENGRGEMYADSPGIIRALGVDPETGMARYDYSRLDPPFTPARYIEAIKEAEKCGINVLVVDSGSHEWEGIGGCTDMAENNKLRGMPNWSLAKREHKRFVNTCLSSSMHIIFCLRARDKVKMVDTVKPNGEKKTDVVPIGLQPICEKSFVFEALVSILLDEKTHHSSPLKVPEPLHGAFSEGRLVTLADGEAIRKWNEAGRVQDESEQVKKRARLAAEGGTKAYEEFFKSLTNKQRSALVGPSHEENKKRAAEVDVIEAELEPEPVTVPTGELDLRRDPKGW